jgi:lysophospholipase L1-like esterase
MNRSRMLLLALVVALAAPATAQAAKPKQQLYVSLGDSYASGFQPTAPGQGANARNGFAYQVPKLAGARGYRFKLVNFGCGGATTTSLLERKGCPPRALGPGGRKYPDRTQVAAAERFLRRHRGKVGLITLSIGGNDVTKCARDADPVPCVVAAVTAINQNVIKAVQRLRAAAGKKVRIVGTTYPDVILGQWVGENANPDLARLSVTAFRDFINPALSKAYQAVGGQLVDVTAASGAYGSLDELVTLPSGTQVPKPVAEVCRLTYYCEFRDIHARTSGYRLIADLVSKTLPRR